MSIPVGSMITKKSKVSCQSKKNQSSVAIGNRESAPIVSNMDYETLFQNTLTNFHCFKRQIKYLSTFRKSITHLETRFWQLSLKAGKRHQSFCEVLYIFVYILNSISKFSLVTNHITQLKHFFQQFLPIDGNIIVNEFVKFCVLHACLYTRHILNLKFISGKNTLNTTEISNILFKIYFQKVLWNQEMYKYFLIKNFRPQSFNVKKAAKMQIKKKSCI